MNKRGWAGIPLLLFFCTAANSTGAAVPQPESGEAPLPVGRQSLQYTVPSDRQVRVIIDSDAACETDDQITIAHALLSSSIEVRGLIGTLFRNLPGFPTKSTDENMQASVQEIHTILRLLGIEGAIPVKHGAGKPFVDANVPTGSEGADLIIQEALAEDPRPLFILCLGPITDLAAAYKKEPKIAGRLTAIWIGGGIYPKGGTEINQDVDRIAANIVMESPIPLWQLPISLYLLPRYGVAEFAEKIGQQGELGRFLFGRIAEFLSKFSFNLGESFICADTSAMGVLLQRWSSPLMGDFETKPAPSIAADGSYVHNGKNRPIRVYRNYDYRANFEEMFAKLKAFARGELKPNYGKQCKARR